MQGYTPHPKQAEAHKAYLVDGYKRGVLFWGRQVGKSLWSVKHLEMAACYKQGQYFIVFNTHKHAKDVMWRQYLKAIPKELIAKTDSDALIITFNYIKAPFYIPGVGWEAIVHDTDEAPSTIQLLGSDYAYDHTGRKAEGIIFDEYQDQDSKSFDETYQPFFTTTDGWACFMGTPRGYNHWYDLIHFAKKPENKRWFYSEATWRDNPAITPQVITDIKKDAKERGMLDIFMQQYELKFHTPESSVYKDFDRKLHVIDAGDERIPQEGEIYGVWDYGYAEGHPMAFNLVRIDGQGRWFVTDEIHGTGIHIDEMIDRIRTRLAMLNDPQRLVGIIADSARPDAIDYARSKGLPVIPAPKRQGSVPAGILLLGQRITPKPAMFGQNEIEFFITEDCGHTIYQFENYKYREVKEDRPTSDLPIKKDDDHPDAIRYLALYLKYGKPKKRVRPKTEVELNSYGLMKS